MRVFYMYEIAINTFFLRPVYWRNIAD
jgi:hypothetical protein